MTADTPEVCAARRELLLRELAAYEGPPDRPGRGKRGSPRPVPVEPPPDLVIHVRVTDRGLRVASPELGRAALVRGRADLADEVCRALALVTGSRVP